MKTKLWRIFLRALRAVTLAVDDWIQRQEVALREGPARARYQAEVDPAQSERREQSIRAGEKFAGVPADGCTSACLTKARKRTGTRDRLSAAVYGPSPAKGVVIIRRPKPVRLRYRAGQFVREV
jgi:hypothetical protein